MQSFLWSSMILPFTFDFEKGCNGGTGGQNYVQRKAKEDGNDFCSSHNIRGEYSIQICQLICFKQLDWLPEHIRDTVDWLTGKER